MGLSGLGSAALVLAVYASLLGLLRLHARLASGWWLASTGRALTRGVSFDRFPLITYMAFSFPRLFLARWHRPRRPRVSARRGTLQESRASSAGPYDFNIGAALRTCAEFGAAAPPS